MEYLDTSLESSLLPIGAAARILSPVGQVTPMVVIDKVGRYRARCGADTQPEDFSYGGGKDR